MGSAVEHVVTNDTADGIVVTTLPSRKAALAMGKQLRSQGAVAYVYSVSDYIQFIDPSFRGGKG